MELDSEQLSMLYLTHPNGAEVLYVRLVDWTLFLLTKKELEGLYIVHEL